MDVCSFEFCRMSGTALPFIGTRARRLAAWLAQFFLFRNANYSHPKTITRKSCAKERARDIYFRIRVTACGGFTVLYSY